MFQVAEIQGIPPLFPLAVKALKGLLQIPQSPQDGQGGGQLPPDLAARPGDRFGGQLLDAGAKSVEQLRELCEYAEMPVIIKGVMTAQGAVKAADAGAAAIVVSNHGGRVLASAAATAEVLPEIVEDVGGRVKIIVDGGIRSGTDIFRALALGADAVMICRPILISYYGGRTDGIVTYVEKLRAELKDAMYMCGARKISDIDRSMIRF